MGRCQIGVRVGGMARRSRRLTAQDLSDEISVTSKAASVCRSYYPNPSGALANCLRDVVNQTVRRIPRYASVGTPAQRQQLKDLAVKLELDAGNILHKARTGRR